MIDGLKVNQKTEPTGVLTDEVMFSWNASGEKQFTVEMCSDSGFRNTVMYIDTRNHFYRYDGLPLKSGTVYYWRVRTGIGSWVSAQFTTG